MTSNHNFKRKKSLLYAQSLFILMFLILSASQFSFAKSKPEINTFGEGGSFFTDPKRTDVAIRGYDTVAYFDSTNEKGQIVKGKPTPGKPEFTFEWKGAKWRFSSSANLEKFKLNPEKYAPQYGGYCAYGVAKKNIVKIEPDQFTILNDKLYLNYDEDIQKDWTKNRDEFIKKADSQFKDLLK